MSKYKDATGYLLELRDGEKSSWFSYACDLALQATSSGLAETELEILSGLFFSTDKYVPSSVSPSIPTTTTTQPPSNSYQLKQLSEYNNFKKLLPTLSVKFDKRLSLIFGKNGSGKSSICESIKTLADPDTPDGPLRNVHGEYKSPPSFLYQFSVDDKPNKWEEGHGYGRFASRIKYFDSTIAFRHISDEYDPEAVIELAPFRLEVFEYCRSFINQLREEVENHIDKAEIIINSETESLITIFQDIDDVTKTSIIALSNGDYSLLEKELSGFVSPSDDELCSFEKNQIQLKRMQDNHPEQSIKLLSNEATVFRRVQKYLHGLYELCNKCSVERLTQHIEKFTEKQAASATLAEDILPNDITVNDFKNFLDSSSKIFNFPATIDASCPFCCRPLDESSLKLIEKYHLFLINTLQQEIEELKKSIDEEITIFEKIRANDLTIDESISNVLTAEQIKQISTKVDKIKSSIPDPISQNERTDFGDYEIWRNLKDDIQIFQKEADDRDKSIKSFQLNETERKQEIGRLISECNRHKFNVLVSENYDNIDKLIRNIKLKKLYEDFQSQADFPSLLKRMTNAGKKAHSDLVIAEFEKKIDREYAALSGMGLSDFRISLIPKGQNQQVVVKPQIGNTPIRRVLSEGEQKIHALALFFCEAISQPSDILVFDDPSTSFDFNNVGFLVERLRDLVTELPDSQFIIFTHNWELFVQFQNVFNKANLNNYLEIMVLEDRRIVRSYSEKLDTLKVEIEGLLELPHDLNDNQKESLSGMLRRLIESVINKCVFNGQRQQYKQRSQNLSVFSEYTKIVPLDQLEAQKLSDLYGRLSMTEHDDVRNNYTAFAKPVFKNIFRDILQIETDLNNRRP